MKTDDPAPPHTNRPDDPQPILFARGLETFYGKVQILHGVDLDIPRGEIVAVIGPNGAGKTTALKALFGLIPVKRGTVTYQGRDITNHSPETLVRRGIGFVPQGRAVFPSLTVEENLHMGGYILPSRTLVQTRTRAVYTRFPSLAERRHQSAGSLSGGEQQMLAIGRALMLEPQVLLLDEPSVGLAPRMVDSILDSIIQVNKEGVSVVIVEQNATLALETADTAYLLVMGRTRMRGPGKSLLNDPKVRTIYLGGAVGDPDQLAREDETG